MNYADIKQYDVANGPGIRISLFVSGCNHHCKGCFNKVAWDFNYGTLFTDETISVNLAFNFFLSLFHNSDWSKMYIFVGRPKPHYSFHIMLMLL